jgi:hypothetical protein
MTPTTALILKRGACLNARMPFWWLASFSYQLSATCFQLSTFFPVLGQIAFLLKANKRGDGLLTRLRQPSWHQSIRVGVASDLDDHVQTAQAVNMPEKFTSGNEA